MHFFQNRPRALLGLFLSAAIAVVSHLAVKNAAAQDTPATIYENDKMGLLIRTGRFNDDFYACPPGSTVCYMIEQRGSSSGDGKMEISGNGGELIVDKNGAVLKTEGGKTFSYKPQSGNQNLSQYKLKDLPADWRMGSAGQFGDETLLYVENYNGRGRYADRIKLYRIQGNKVEQLSFADCERLRDGGTTMFELGDGKSLVFPAYASRNPKWGDKEGTTISREQAKEKYGAQVLPNTVEAHRNPFKAKGWYGGPTQ